MSDLDDKLKQFEERISIRKPAADALEAQKEAQRQEDLRQNYLKRTGRKDLTP